MDYKKKLKQIPRSDKQYLWVELGVDSDQGRMTLSRYNRGEMSDAKSALMEKAIDTVYQESKYIKYINDIEFEAKHIIVGYNHESVEITYNELIIIHVGLIKEDVNPKDVVHMMDKSREGILNIYNKTPIDLKRLIIKHLVKNKIN